MQFISGIFPNKDTIHLFVRSISCGCLISAFQGCFHKKWNLGMNGEGNKEIMNPREGPRSGNARSPAPGRIAI